MNELLDPGAHIIHFPSFDPNAAELAAEMVTYPDCDGSGCSPSASSTVTPLVVTLSDTAGAVCLEPIPATTRSDYTPNRPTHPCFASAPADLSLVTSGDDIPLRAARLAATFVEGDPRGLATGLAFGFISEDTAGTVNATIDGVTSTFRSILPGGGGCLGGDRRTSFEGDIGWWLYSHFAAVEVTYTP